MNIYLILLDTQNILFLANLVLPSSFVIKHVFWPLRIFIQIESKSFIVWDYFGVKMKN